MTFEARPPAKVNLTLEVAGRRADGYHDLRSIFLRVGLSDRLLVEPGGADGSDRVTVTGFAVGSTRDNLVTRALQAIRLHTGVDLPALDVTLEKRIPVAAGLGGGSSDAAFALKLATACWGVGISAAEELALAASLGSDVPFFVADEVLAEVGGRGEIVNWLPSERLRFGVVLVTPPIALRTARVFERFDVMNPDPRSVTTAGAVASEALAGILWDEPLDDEIVAWSRDHADSNDLWLAASSLEPSLVALRAALEGGTGRRWLLSGSGPTLFAIYPSAREAADAGRALAGKQLPQLQSAVMNAVDLVGPDPIWRYP